ncbi:MAG: YciI family protein, partial [Bacteroidota bacterium]
MYYILFYKTVENYVERRTQFRAKHLAYANKYFEEGKLILAGALANPVDEAILVFKGESQAIA